MAKRINPEILEEDATPVVDSPEIVEIPEVVPQPEVQPEPVSAVVPVVELDDVIQAESLTPAQRQHGQSFWFGEIALLTFPDKTTYHIRGRNAFITDPQLIENLKAHAASNPTAKIFLQ